MNRIHGGDIYRNQVCLDFSVNINPLGIPKLVKQAVKDAVEICDNYPDIEAEQLKEAVSKFLTLKKENLLFGNGASELFMAIVHSIRPKKVVIPVPSFYGYEYAASSVDSEILFYKMKWEHNFCLTKEIKKSLTKDIDLLFLANPNNPVGNLLTKELIIELLQICKEQGIYMVVDECFIEFCGKDFSILSELENIEAKEYLIIVRAFTKIFAIPGVRLGYLICKNKLLLAKIQKQLPEWNLSCFAQKAGCCCASQTEFIRKTEIYIKEERSFLEQALKQKGYDVFPAMANFIMIYSKKPLYENLLKKGILIRDCGNFRGLGNGFYRIAIKSREENEFLLKYL